MEKNKVLVQKKALKKHQLQKLVPGVTDKLFRNTVWDVVSEFRNEEKEAIKCIQTVLPDEITEIINRLQF